MDTQLKRGARVISSTNAFQDTPPIDVYFDIVQEHSIDLQSQTTDNWLENNTVINDHIVNSPIMISLRGLSGEVVYESSSWNKYIGNKITSTIGVSASNKLGALTSLLPPIDNVTQLAKNVISYTEASYKKYEKVVKRFINGKDYQTILQKIYADLIAIREEKKPLEVITPFNTFFNMYIQSITLRQDNQEHIADIEITLKQLNFANGATTEINEKNREQCNFIQRDDVQNHGYVQGNNVSLDSGDGSGNLVFNLSATINEYK